MAGYQFTIMQRKVLREPGLNRLIKLNDLLHFTKSKLYDECYGRKNKAGRH